MTTLIVIVGVRGCGKSTLLEHLTQNQDTVFLQPSTSRPPRSAGDNEYDFRESESISGSGEEFAWQVRVGDYEYGMRKTELERVGRGGIGVTVFDPSLNRELERIKRELPFEIITIGLDTIDDVAEQNLRVQQDTARVLTSEQLENQVETVRDSDVVLRGDSNTICAAADAVLSCLKRGGLLHGDAVHAMVAAETLLKNANLDHVSTASYDLTLHDDAWCQSKFITLTDENPILTIPPYSYAIVRAKEEAALPRFVAAHYDLRLRLFFSGLILSNGPQVDPGYSGPLFCLLYNGSDQPYPLSRGNHFASIEFVTTTKVTEGYQGEHRAASKLQDFIPPAAAIGSGGRIFDRVAKVEGEVQGVYSKFYRALALAVTIMLFLLGVSWKIAVDAKTYRDEALRAVSIGRTGGEAPPTPASFTPTKGPSTVQSPSPSPSKPVP